ncbi:MAG: 5-deoxy-glucuronate isomerase [Bryobacteraceae bacterium]|jgi:5-deoxy-glucuronate isomerase
MSVKGEDAARQMVFRRTNAHVGRLISVTPANSTNRHLCYGRIILKGDTKSVSFNTGERETGLILLAGAARVGVDGQDFDLVQHDAIYIPRDSAVRVSADAQVDIVELAADVLNRYPLQVVKYAEISKDPTLKFTAGEPGQRRHLNILLGKNIEAGRLVAGFTISDPGNWTSWPPHEHTAMLEEMYIYVSMPEPAFAIQLVYDNTEYPELLTVVRDGDAVLMPSGYHPNVSIPGHSVGFVWAMAAHREKEDRQFGVVNVQPGFGKGGSGLEASRK